MRPCAFSGSATRRKPDSTERIARQRAQDGTNATRELEFTRTMTPGILRRSPSRGNHFTGPPPAAGRAHEGDGAIVVQRTDLTAEEEILVLLHYAGELGFSRKELGQHCMRSAPAITIALQDLVSPSCREVVLLPCKNYRLTDLGSRRIREGLVEKLLLE